MSSKEKVGTKEVKRKKRRYNPGETKEILINSAETLFLKKGFAATSTEEISRLANCSKSQVQYHFTTKQKLWEAVIEKRVNDFFDAVQRLFATIVHDKDSLKEGILTFFKYLKKNQQIITIIKWTSIEGVPVDLNLRDRTHRLAVDTLKGFQKDGVLQNGIDPDYIVYAILGLIFHWFEIRGSQISVQAGNSSLNKKDRAYLDTIVKIIYDGIFL
jgi:AcrR family transcriptional regulator